MTRGAMDIDVCSCGCEMSGGSRRSGSHHALDVARAAPVAVDVEVGRQVLCYGVGGEDCAVQVEGYYYLGFFGRHFCLTVPEFASGIDLEDSLDGCPRRF